MARKINDSIIDLELYKKIKTLKKIRKKIADKSLTSTENFRRKNHWTLHQFVFQNDYFFELTKDEFFLILCRFLTVYKTFDSSAQPVINFFQLGEELKASKDTVRRLVLLYQRKLAQMSCEFIFDLSKDIREPGFDFNSLKKLSCLDDNNREVLPCYLTMQLMLAHMLRQNISVILRAKRIFRKNLYDTVVIYFKANSQKDDFEACQVIPDFSPFEPCYVLEGITEYYHYPVESQQKFIERILTTSLKKILLLSQAVHPQYSGKNLEKFRENPYLLLDEKHEMLEKDLLIMRQQANMIGCAMGNPSLFYIEHIFCDDVYEHVKVNKTQRDVLPKYAVL